MYIYIYIYIYIVCVCVYLFKGKQIATILLSWGIFGASFGPPGGAFGGLWGRPWGTFSANLGLEGLGRGAKAPRRAQGRAQGLKKK